MLERRRLREEEDRYLHVERYCGEKRERDRVQVPRPDAADEHNDERRERSGKQKHAKP